jgi:hypothetical protein
VTQLAVTFTVHNRPALLRQALDGWQRVRGIEEALLIFCCEPGCDEAADMCRAVDFAANFTVVNDRRLGHAANTARSMSYAYTSAGYAVAAVEDYVPSAGLLELHQWFRVNYAGDPSVLALSSARDVPAPHGGLAGVWRCQLIGALPGFHKAKWELLAARWDEATDAGWWQWVNFSWLQSGPCYDVLFPSVSYAMALDDPAANSCFIPDPPPQDYYEITGQRERADGFTRSWTDPG